MNLTSIIDVVILVGFATVADSIYLLLSARWEATSLGKHLDRLHILPVFW